MSGSRRLAHPLGRMLWPKTTRESSDRVTSLLGKAAFVDSHSQGGHSRVKGSMAATLYTPPSRVKRFTGYPRNVGGIPASGHRPLSSAGTAWVVSGAAAVARRYQLVSRASRANAGYRTSSTLPSGVSSELVGSASKTTNAIGGLVSARRTGAGVSCCAGSQSSFIPGLRRNAIAKTTENMADSCTNLLAGALVDRTTLATPPSPQARAAATSGAAPGSVDVRPGKAPTATNNASLDLWPSHRAREPRRPSVSSNAIQTAGTLAEITRVKATTSRPRKRCRRKNSG